MSDGYLQEVRRVGLPPQVRQHQEAQGLLCPVQQVRRDRAQGKASHVAPTTKAAIQSEGVTP